MQAQTTSLIANTYMYLKKLKKTLSLTKQLVYNSHTSRREHASHVTYTRVCRTHAI